MGVVYEYLTYGGKSSRDFLVWISGSGTYDTPQRNIENIAIPGRNGDLHIDNGNFDNIPITYPAFITEKWRQNFDAFRAFMCAQSGAQKLEDSYDPDHYRIATYKGSIQPKMSTLNRAGEFDIVFDCDPRRFLKEGDKPIEVQTSPHTSLKNNTFYTAKPKVRIKGNASFYWKQPGESVTRRITTSGLASTDYTIIDSETEEAYDEATGTDRNSNITFVNGNDFPVLKPGNTEMYDTGYVSWITPRWWTI